MTEVTGILMPHLMYRFSLRVGVKDQDVVDTFARQVLSVKFDYCNNTFDMIVEQPLCGGALHQFVYEWIHPNKLSPTTLEIWAGTEDEPGYILRFLNLRCTRHNFELGYEKCQPSQHQLTFKFDHLIMGDLPE